MSPEQTQALYGILIFCLGAVAMWFGSKLRASGKIIEAKAEAEADDTAIKSKSVKFVMELSQQYVALSDRLFNLERAYTQRVEKLNSEILELREQVAQLTVRLHECIQSSKKT